MSDLFLKHHHALKQCFRSWRTAGDIYVNREESLAALHCAVSFEDTAGAGATTHRDDIPGLGDLVENSSDNGGHLLCDGACNYDTVSLPWRASENNTESVEVVV